MNKFKKWTRAACIVGGLVAALPTFATTLVYDFEDGTLQGWLTTATGGSGSTGVELHNGSKAAFGMQTGGGIEALAHDFTYDPNSTLAFDMQAIANIAINSHGQVADSESGVTLSFSNAFNVALGSVSFLDVTNVSWLTTHSFQINSDQHNYAGTMASFALAAGLAPAASIAKVSLSFFAQGQTVCFVDCATSTAKVWLDNVTISAVPEPGGQALMWAGLAAVGLVVRRHRQHA